MKNTYDVLIVGAGPVGLWLACELKLSGVDVAVVERRMERSPYSRALTIHGRTLEVFALRGLAERFLANGQQIRTGHYGVLDTRLDFSPFETRFPYTLFIPQAITERILEERALELGVEILRGYPVTGLQEKENHICLFTQDAELTAAYIIGADGARSLVREHAGIGFEGFDARNSLILGDVVLDAPPSQPTISVCNEKGLAMIAPLGDGIHHRIVLIDPIRIHIARTEPVTFEELIESTKRIVGKDHRPRDPIWLSRFTDETRLATTYRKDRILIAGDAAHIHTPMGGQGMNVGLQDAMNLGWKLAAVVKGIAPVSLLDSYEEERRPVAVRLFANTLAQVALTTHFDPATLALRETFNKLLTIPEINRRLAGELSGFDVAYGHEAKKNLTDDLAVGVRMPDMDLTMANGKTVSLYSLLDKGNWLHLSSGTKASEQPPWLPANAVLKVTAKKFSLFRQVSTLLIRPDGYIASVSQTLNFVSTGMIKKVNPPGLTQSFKQMISQIAITPSAARLAAISGQVAVDASGAFIGGDHATQARQCFANILIALTAINAHLASSFFVKRAILSSKRIIFM